VTSFGGIHDGRGIVVAISTDPISFSGTPARANPVWIVGAALFVALVFGGVFALGQGSAAADVFGDFAVLLSAVIAAVCCFRASRGRGPDARGWLFMGIASAVWATAQGAEALSGVVLGKKYPFPSLIDVGYLSYAIPVIVALVMFKGIRFSGTAWLRAVLDAAVIASATLFVNWATVLGPIYQAKSESSLGKLAGLSYPIVDVVITSSVLVLAMRRVPGQRRSWLILGAGLLVLTSTDTVFVSLTFRGLTDLTGTPLACGWVAAFVLIALATVSPKGARSRPDGRGYTLALELVPYIPVTAAAVIASANIEFDPFLAVSGLIVVVLVLVRQVLIVYENVTLTRELEQKVAKRTAELEGLAAIVNSSADAIVGTDYRGAIVSWNPGAEALYGYTAAEAIGHDHSFLRNAQLGDAEVAGFEKLLTSGQPVSYQTERVRKNGTIVPVALTASPIRGDSGIRGVAMIGQDITERRESEAALLLAREEALESSRLKSEFLATMSHEIRTPMNGVIGLTTLLLDTPLNQTQRKYADGVQSAGQALLTLINDILDFSKLEAGKVELEIAPFDPRVLVEEVAGLVSESARAKDLELMAYCRPEVPAKLVGDVGRIRQILLNLASNALKFTEVGEVAIRVDVIKGGILKADVLKADGDLAQVRFEVRDTGIGVDEVDHARLFESFSQADASTTRRYGGTGLGLAISQRLTEAMGGEMGVTSELGEGSIFWFVVPLATVADPSLAASESVQPDFSYARLAGRRVLVVDDNATNRLVLESQLGGWSMVPESVSDAASALEKIREAAAAGRPFDIAVLDMCMPDMDGLELAREISADENLSDTSLIMLTSTPQMDRAELTAAGVRQWLMKPVRSSEFYDRLMLLVAGSTPTAPTRVPQQNPTSPSRGLVLVVEDNEVNQLVAREMVAKLGYRVEVVSDGAEAVAAMDGTLYDAVLMDCHMPIMDGFEATGAIRSLTGPASRVPIIAMTAGAQDEDRRRCLEAGMDDFLTKPVDMVALEDTLAQWVHEAAKQLPDSSSDPLPEALLQPDEEEPALDPIRLDLLRHLGPLGGHGLLTEAAHAFRSEVGASLTALKHAIDGSDDEALKRAAHKLKGGAANIGATGAAALCAQLEKLVPSDGDHPGRHLVGRLEAELARVDAALDRALEAVS
jgi:two-component system sensor histidine kinase/response regulator